MIPDYHHPLSGFSQLQGFSRRPVPAALPASPQVWSLSAPLLPGVTNMFPHTPRSAHRFSQPLGRNDARSNPWVCSTPQALGGSWPSESDPRSIGNRLRPFMLLRCSLPFMASFRISPAPASCPTTPAYPLAGPPAAISARSGCSPHQGRGPLPSWTSVNLEAFFPTVSASFPSQFHPLLTLAPLLALFLFRVSPGLPWACALPLSGFFAPIGSFCIPGGHSTQEFSS